MRLRRRFPPGMRAPVASPEARWHKVLDQLERDASAIESGDRILTEWTPPDNIGPLPAELADRARHVKRRLDNAMSTLSRERDDTLAQLGALRKMPEPDHAARPVFLDVSA